jgi:hypothetical protein
MVNKSYSPKSDVHVSSENRAGCQTHYHRLNKVRYIAVCPSRGNEVEFLHDEIVWMSIRCVVSLVEYHEADVAAHDDVAMTESIQQDLRGGDHHSIIAEHVSP